MNRSAPAPTAHRLDTVAALEVAFDAHAELSPLHIWSSGTAVCGLPIVHPTVFRAVWSHVTDICCPSCERVAAGTGE